MSAMGRSLDIQFLAKSEHFSIWHEHEEVFVGRHGKSPVLIGDFYGDPECAIIDWGERWCVIGGCGLIVYRFAKPYRPYKYNSITNKIIKQWSELHRGGDWWIETIYQVEDDVVRFVVDLASVHAGFYDLRLHDMAVSKLFPNNDFRSILSRDDGSRFDQ